MDNYKIPAQAKGWQVEETGQEGSGNWYGFRIENGVKNIATAQHEDVADAWRDICQSQHIETLQQCAERVVRQGVLCCVSNLVHTISQADVARDGSAGRLSSEMVALVDQARDLGFDVPDYEEAAIQAGWTPYFDKFGVPCWRHKEDDATFAASHDGQVLCGEFDIDPYDREVFEHWAVDNWLADKLEAKGEKVDRDFAGLNVWARTTTGQQISADCLFEQIARDIITAK